MKKIFMFAAMMLVGFSSLASAADAPITHKPPNSCPSDPDNPKCIRPLTTTPVVDLFPADKCKNPNLPTGCPRPLATTQSIYECKRGIDGVTRCRKLRDDGEFEAIDLTMESLEQVDLAELLAVIRTVKTRQPTPVLYSSVGPILECGHGHGQSACCQIIAGGGDLTYTECK